MAVPSYSNCYENYFFISIKNKNEREIFYKKKPYLRHGRNVAWFKPRIIRARSHLASSSHELDKKDTLSVDRQKMWTYTLPDAWLQKRGFRYLLNIVYYVQVESMRRVVQKWVLFFTWWSLDIITVLFFFNVLCFCISISHKKYLACPYLSQMPRP